MRHSAGIVLSAGIVTEVFFPVDSMRWSQSDIEAPIPAEEGKKDASPPKVPKDRFVGANGLLYVLWGHYLAYGSAMMCLLMGEQWC